VAGYQITRNGVVHTTAATSYTDTGLSPLTPYTYTVAAFDYATNISAPSAPLTVTTTAPAPSFVQASVATPQTPQTLVSATYASAQTAGDTDLLAIGWNDTTATITAVTDTAGNVYHPAGATVRGSGLSQALYYAANIVAAAAGANQVRVSFDRPAAFVDLRITEYAGLRAAAPFDIAVSASGSGSAGSSGALSPPAPNELLFAAGMTGAVFSAAGAGFTTRLITSPDGDLLADAITTSTAPVTATASLSAGTWLLQLAAFAPAGP
jgi:chitodextrinase